MIKRETEMLEKCSKNFEKKIQINEKKIFKKSKFTKWKILRKPIEVNGKTKDQKGNKILEKLSKNNAKIQINEKKILKKLKLTKWKILINAIEVNGKKRWKKKQNVGKFK